MAPFVHSDNYCTYPFQHCITECSLQSSHILPQIPCYSCVFVLRLSSPAFYLPGIQVDCPGNQSAVLSLHSFSPQMVALCLNLASYIAQTVSIHSQPEPNIPYSSKTAMGILGSIFCVRAYCILFQQVNFLS